MWLSVFLFYLNFARTKTNLTRVIFNKATKKIQLYKHLQNIVKQKKIEEILENYYTIKQETDHIE